MPPHIEGEMEYTEFGAAELANKIQLQSEIMKRFAADPETELGWEKWTGEIVCGELARTDVLTYICNRKEIKSKLSESVTPEFVEEVFQSMNQFIEKYKEEHPERRAA